MVKDMDYDNLPEKQYLSKMESVKQKLGECKLIRAQAKAVLRELVPWHICSFLFPPIFTIFCMGFSLHKFVQDNRVAEAK